MVQGGVQVQTWDGTPEQGGLHPDETLPQFIHSHS